MGTVKQNKTSKPNRRRVIDAENYRQLRWFDKEETDKLVKEYEKSGKWAIVHVDYDGDIILNN
jgi:hypothetical protein